MQVVTGTENHFPDFGQERLDFPAAFSYNETKNDREEKTMKQRLMRLLIPFLVQGAILLLLPLLIRDTGSAMAVLLLYIPTALCLHSLVCGLRMGFAWELIVSSALLFAVTIPIYYNESACIYCAVFAGMSALGLGLGTIIRKSGRRE